MKRMKKSLVSFMAAFKFLWIAMRFIMRSRRSSRISFRIPNSLNVPANSSSVIIAAKMESNGIVERRSTHRLPWMYFFAITFAVLTI